MQDVKHSNYLPTPGKSIMLPLQWYGSVDAIEKWVSAVLWVSDYFQSCNICYIIKAWWKLECCIDVMKYLCRYSYSSVTNTSMFYFSSHHYYASKKTPWLCSYLVEDSMKNIFISSPDFPNAIAGTYITIKFQYCTALLQIKLIGEINWKS